MQLIDNDQSCFAALVGNARVWIDSPNSAFYRSFGTVVKLDIPQASARVKLDTYPELGSVRFRTEELVPFRVYA
jgi:hypothetical protein